MQIILNSCFHYIIPRPDGTEENGQAFREAFARRMKDDAFLLSVLPTPWNDLTIDRNDILRATEEEAAAAEMRNSKKSAFDTPNSSPRLTSLVDDGSPGNDTDDGDSSITKRAVLLCFNENVRSAEDVFRCHNEFIRDTAHASNLQLSSSEWRIFFGNEAAKTPYIWGNVGIPAPFLEGQGHAHTDALGVFTKGEVAALRTSWCSKRYDHDHELCGFAHPEVNGGWLRRNPTLYPYKDEMCKYVQSISLGSRESSKKVVMLNECPKGSSCEFAHSVEEIVYHPWRYKQKICPSTGRPGGCSLGELCPKFHAADSYRFPKKSDVRSPRHARQIHQVGGKGGSSSASPFSGSPVLYASPAPISSFERNLQMPGLQSLFRRQSFVTQKLIREGGGTSCMYSLFGDQRIHENQDQNLDRKKAIGSLPCFRK
jgi:hypothetical protein